MGAKVFFRPEDYATAKSISDTLGLTSGYSHSETLREGLSSEGRAEQAVAVLTPRELMEMGDRDIIFFYKNLKPARGRRLEHWGFPCLKNGGVSHRPQSTSFRSASRFFRCHQAASLLLMGATDGDGRAFPIDPDDLN